MGLELSDVVRIIKRWFMWIVAITAVTVVVSSLIYDRLPKMYESSAVLKISGTSPVGSFMGIQLPKVSGGGADDYIEIMRSRKVLERVIDRENLIDRILGEGTGELLEKGYSHDDLVEIVYRKLKSDLNVETLGKSSLISISYRSKDPRLSYDVVKGVVDSFEEFIGGMMTRDVRRRKSFLEGKLKEIYSEYRKRLEEFVEFQKSTGIPSLQDELSFLTRNYLQAYVGILSARISIDGKEKLINDLRSELSSADPAEDIGNILSLSRTVMNLEGELEGLKVVYPEDNVNVRSLRAKLDFLKDRLEKSKKAASEVPVSISTLINRLSDEMSDLERLRSSIEANEKIMEALSSRINEVLGIERDYVYFQTQLTVMEEMIKLTWQQYLAALLDEVSNLSKISVVSPPVYTNVPSTVSKKIVLALSGALGIFIGIIFAFWRESTHPKVTDYRLFSKEWNIEDFVVVRRKDVFRGMDKLAARIRNERGVLIITGASEGEGKTNLTLNLAEILAKIGKKILVVDGDLEKKELTSRMSGRKTPFEFLSPTSYDFEIPEGYDLVLVDSPSFSESAIGVSALVDSSDGVILVVGEMVSDRNHLTDLMRLVSGKIKLVVFTNVRWNA